MRRLAAGLAVLALLAACGDDGDDGGGAITEVTGIVNASDGSGSGSLFVEVQAAELVRAARTASAVAASRAPVSATGDVTIFGSTTDLSGTYDPDTGLLLLEGGGYSFDGLYTGETITGTWTGPGATGGTFVAAPGQGEAFCGTYLIYTEEPPEEGTFSFVVVGQAAFGEVISEDGTAFPLYGELTGPLSATAVNIAFFLPGTTTAFASGNINDTSTSGGFNVPDGEGGFESGNWTGSPAFCEGQT